MATATAGAAIALRTTVGGDITVELGVIRIVATKAEDKGLTVGTTLMPGLQTANLIPAVDGRMKAMARSTTLRNTATKRITAADKTMEAATTSNGKLQQDVAESTNSATLFFCETTLAAKLRQITDSANPGRESIFMHIDLSKRRRSVEVLVACLFAFLGTNSAPAQQLDTASVIEQVDAAVKARIDNVVGYTDTEHYAVYRSNDEVHPVAEMTVITTYKKDSGKSYAIVSQTGSEIIQKLVLDAILDNEKHLNEPGIREGAWVTSANYEMSLKPGGIQLLDGRSCLALTLIPRRKASFLIDGTLWVDSTNGSIVQLQGFTSKNSSLVTGPTQVMRQYANVDGFSQATHVRAVSNSFMFGQTIVKIDYRDYKIQLNPPL
jgi:hypothetical protein